MLIVPRSVSVFVLSALLMAGHRMGAQPDLARWSRMVTDLEAHGWVTELEALEPGCILGARSPELRITDWPARSPWAEQLVSELEALPGAEHHADQALQRLLENGMRRFQLVEAQADRSRPAMETLLETAGLAEEWALLPMALTGWDVGYYGPGRRAGAWAMDLPTALSLGLEVRRGWDERHLAERMNPAMVRRIALATDRHPTSPLLQVLDVVQGPRAAERFDAEFAEADLLGWLHLVRVWFQVDRNFQRDRLNALWLLRDKPWTEQSCSPTHTHAHFRALDALGLDIRTLRRENPWYTTDSIGWTAQRPGLRVPDSVATPNLQESWEAWCSWRPEPEEIQYSQVHIVQPGEVLGTIARRYGVRIGELRTWNDLEGDLIRVGQSLTLLVPPTRQAPAPTPRPAQDTPDPGAFRWHTVQEGESYWSIAQQYPNVSFGDLLRINDTDPAQLRPDMRIRIPQR